MMGFDRRSFIQLTLYVFVVTVVLVIPAILNESNAAIFNEKHSSAWDDKASLHGNAGARTLYTLSNFHDPSTIRYKKIDDEIENVATQVQQQRSRCKIVFILGVEGTMHHGISPVLVQLANQQIDPLTGSRYHVQFESKFLRYGLFGWPGWVGKKFNYKELPQMNDHILVQKVLSAICPNNGKTHVIIEGASFPSGDDTGKTKLRVKRHKEWQNMSPEEISVSPAALNHPLNLEQFYNAYSSHAEIKFIVLHRPHLEVVGSHPDFDSGPIAHSRVLQGFLLILKRFLESHRHDVSGERLWSVFHVERLSARFYGPINNRMNHKSAFDARRQLIRDMAIFLGWPQTECEHCFNTWKDSTKDYEKMFPADELQELQRHAADVQTIWPPSQN